MRFATILNIFLLFSSGLCAQNIRLSGTVIDIETHQPVPLVNVFTNDRRFGTISNDRGVFSLYVPQVKLNTYLHFSSMNFEADSVLITRTNMPEVTFLVPTSFMLDEIVVMTDCSLLTLLRQAYARIPENFSNQPVLYTGFFQESTSDESGELISLVEAELSVFKEAKHRMRASAGQIEILQSRIIKLQPVRSGFVGGAFLPISDDVVLQRRNFIRPQHFQRFQYTFLGITSWRGRPTYMIEFSQRNRGSGSMQGTMLIDKETLAYVSFDVTIENPDAARAFIATIRPIKSNRRVVYEQHNGKWHLMQASARTRHENVRMNAPLYSSFDFITTRIQTDNVRPIPLDRRLGYMDVIEVTAERFSPDGWTDFDMINDNVLTQMGFQFSATESYSIFHQDVHHRRTFREVTMQALPRIVYGIGLQYNPNYSLFTYHTVLGYRLNRQWSIQAKGVSDFYDNRVALRETSLGVEYRRNLNNAGYPPFLGTSLWISDNSFRRIGHDRLHYQAIVPKLSLSRRINRFATFEIFVNYHFIIHSNIEMNRRRSPQVGISFYMF